MPLLTIITNVGMGGTPSAAPEGPWFPVQAASDTWKTKQAVSDTWKSTGSPSGSWVKQTDS